MGAWFLGTLVFSIPAFWFYDPLLDHAQYIVGSDRDTRVAFGALCSRSVSPSAASPRQW
jgi:hypothetical protein